MGFDPATLAIAATVGSSAIQGMGAIQQSQASAASAGYNAKIAGMNAQIQTQNANFAGAQGEQEVGVQGMKNKAEVGSITASQAASGVDVNTGSGVNVRQSAAEVGMLNALTIRSNAAKQAYGYQVQATNDTAQAALDRSQQSADKTAGYLNAGADILGGVGKAAFAYLGGSDPTGGITAASAAADMQTASPIGADFMSQNYPQF